MPRVRLGKVPTMPHFNPIIFSGQKIRVKTIPLTSFGGYAMHGAQEGHLWRAVVLRITTRRHVVSSVGITFRRRVASSEVWLGTLSFRVPRDFIIINRRLIPPR